MTENQIVIIGAALGVSIVLGLVLRGRRAKPATTQARRKPRLSKSFATGTSAVRAKSGNVAISSPRAASATTSASSARTTAAATATATAPLVVSPDAVQRFAEAGHSLARIARRFGVTQDAIRAALTAPLPGNTVQSGKGFRPLTASAGPAGLRSEVEKALWI